LFLIKLSEDHLKENKETVIRAGTQLMKKELFSIEKEINQDPQLVANQLFQAALSFYYQDPIEEGELLF